MATEATPCIPPTSQNTPENFKRFFSAVNCMRHNQRSYFRDRDSVSLALAKRYEREVDAMLREFSEPPKPIQEELFQ